MTMMMACVQASDAEIWTRNDSRRSLDNSNDDGYARSIKSHTRANGSEILRQVLAHGRDRGQSILIGGNGDEEGPWDQPLTDGEVAHHLKSAANVPV